MVFCTSGPNLAILAWRGDELSHGHAQNGVNVDFEVKFHLEDQCQSSLKTIGILTKVFSNYVPNMVILAWKGDELSSWQTSDNRTHRCTDRQRQATTIPKGLNWPRVKIRILLKKVCFTLGSVTFCCFLHAKIWKTYFWPFLAKYCIYWNSLYLKLFSVWIIQAAMHILWTRGDWRYCMVIYCSLNPG